VNAPLRYITVLVAFALSACHDPSQTRLAGTWVASPPATRVGDFTQLTFLNDHLISYSFLSASGGPNVARMDTITAEESYAARDDLTIQLGNETSDVYRYRIDENELEISQDIPGKIPVWQAFVKAPKS
jgi:hypothetical protein